MRTILLVVGKTTSAPLAHMIDDYVERVSHFVPFAMEVIPELKNVRSLTVEQLKEREAQDIMARLKPGDYLILLDERGQQFRSVEFARYVDKTQSLAASRIVYLIGGPYGFATSVYRRANHKVSLSAMTFSHQMIRLLFVEQFYRAYTILHNMPYHHE